MLNLFEEQFYKWVISRRKTTKERKDENENVLRRRLMILFRHLYSKQLEFVCNEKNIRDAQSVEPLLLIVHIKGASTDLKRR